MTRSAFYGQLLYRSAWLIGLLPLSWLRWAGAALGRLNYALDSRETRVTRRNLALIGLVGGASLSGLAGSTLRTGFLTGLASFVGLADDLAGFAAFLLMGHRLRRSARALQAAPKALKISR